MTRPSLEELEEIFKALGNINRLRLLIALQTPASYADLDLPPSRGDHQGSDSRAISRQAVRNHIQTLHELGLVREAEASRTGTTRFVVDHARLYQVIEQVRRLTTLRPDTAPEGETVELEVQFPHVNVEGPHLVLVRGVHEGAVFRLDEGGKWLVGRHEDADIVLDYDPYVSARHALVVRAGTERHLEALAESRNGTYLNWARLEDGAVAPLTPGDVIGVGTSLLVYRA